MNEQKIEFTENELDVLKIMFGMMDSVLEHSYDLHVGDFNSFDSNDLFNLKCKLGIEDVI